MKNNNYIDTVNDEVKQYFKILSKEFPDFLNEYINDTELKRLAGVGMFCGTDHTKMFNNRYWFSRLDHSVGVALIIWNFTKDKKQTISGLLHDFSTPVFSHVIDFLRGDHKNQESTEKDNKKMLLNSKKLIKLLEKDNIKLEEVENYKIYPIADNEAHKLSADRLEYTFSTGMIMAKDIWTLEKIKSVYDNIEILKNEENIVELGFTDINLMDKFVNASCKVASIFLTNEDKLVMQYMADLVKLMVNKNYLNIDDLYKYSEKEILNKIEKKSNEEIKNAYLFFVNMKTIHRSNNKVKDKYCISVEVKKRFINPLIEFDNKILRAYDISNQSHKVIDKVLNYNDSKYAYVDIDFLK